MDDQREKRGWGSGDVHTTPPEDLIGYWENRAVVAEEMVEQLRADLVDKVICPPVVAHVPKIWEAYMNGYKAARSNMKKIFWKFYYVGGSKDD